MGSPPVQSRGEGITGAVRRRAHRARLHCDDFRCRRFGGRARWVHCICDSGKGRSERHVVNDALNVLHLT